MFEEFTANRTWTLVPKQQHFNIIGINGCTYQAEHKWLFCSLQGPVMDKGFHQRPGVDYTDPYSPIMKTQTITLVLCVALSKRWPIFQIDINNVFLYGTIEQDIYMTQPQAFIHPQFLDHVSKLHKALYNLKQAPRAQFHALKQFLFSIGFTNSRSDTSLFVYHYASMLANFLVYVDDLFLTGNDPKFINSFKLSLANKFSCKDLRLTSHFFGIELVPTPDNLLLTQHYYICDLLHKHSMHDAKLVCTLMSTSFNIAEYDDTTSCDEHEYRQLVGSL